jgi:3-hydroxybutyryl-CoA dehydrogenase
LVISEGSWAPGLENLAHQAGYAVSSVPDPEEPPAVCFLAAGRAEEAPSLLSWYDQSLPPEVPIIVQCADMALSEMAAWVQHPERLVGFDGLFFANGDLATLVLNPAFNDDLIPAVELAIRSLGRETVWIAEGPATVLPRIVGQLVNEAAFAVLDGVADAETVDTAMKLGVNYPRGPLEWGRQLGYDKILAVLEHLHAEYREERYRPCVLLRRWARQTSIQ